MNVAGGSTSKRNVDRPLPLLAILPDLLAIEDVPFQRALAPAVADLIAASPVFVAELVRRYFSVPHDNIVRALAASMPMAALFDALQGLFVGNVAECHHLLAEVAAKGGSFRGLEQHALLDVILEFCEQEQSLDQLFAGVRSLVLILPHVCHGAGQQVAPKQTLRVLARLVHLYVAGGGAVPVSGLAAAAAAASHSVQQGHRRTRSSGSAVGSIVSTRRFSNTSNTQHVPLGADDTSSSIIDTSGVLGTPPMKRAIGSSAQSSGSPILARTPLALSSTASVSASVTVSPSTVVPSTNSPAGGGGGGVGDGGGGGSSVGGGGTMVALLATGTSSTASGVMTSAAGGSMGAGSGSGSSNIGVPFGSGSDTMASSTSSSSLVGAVGGSGTIAVAGGGDGSGSGGGGGLGNSTAAGGNSKTLASASSVTAAPAAGSFYSTATSDYVLVPLPERSLKALHDACEALFYTLYGLFPGPLLSFLRDLRPSDAIVREFCVARFDGISLHPHFVLNGAAAGERWRAMAPLEIMSEIQDLRVIQGNVWHNSVAAEAAAACVDQGPGSSMTAADAGGSMAISSPVDMPNARFGTPAAWLASSPPLLGGSESAAVTPGSSLDTGDALIGSTPQSPPGEVAAAAAIAADAAASAAAAAAALVSPAADGTMVVMTSSSVAKGVQMKNSLKQARGIAVGMGVDQRVTDRIRVEAGNLYAEIAALRAEAHRSGGAEMATPASVADVFALRAALLHESCVRAGYRATISRLRSELRNAQSQAHASAAAAATANAAAAKVAQIAAAQAASASLSPSDGNGVAVANADSVYPQSNSAIYTTNISHSATAEPTTSSDGAVTTVTAASSISAVGAAAAATAKSIKMTESPATQWRADRKRLLKRMDEQQQEILRLQALIRADAEPGGTSSGRVAKLEAEIERLSARLALAEASERATEDAAAARSATERSLSAVLAQLSAWEEERPSRSALRALTAAVRAREAESQELLASYRMALDAAQVALAQQTAQLGDFSARLIEVSRQRDEQDEALRQHKAVLDDVRGKTAAEMHALEAKYAAVKRFNLELQHRLLQIDIERHSRAANKAVLEAFGTSVGAVAP